MASEIRPFVRRAGRVRTSFASRQGIGYEYVITTSNGLDPAIHKSRRM